MSDEIARQIPPELIALILEYEGGIVRAIQQDFIGQIYIHVYRGILGWYACPLKHWNTFIQMATYIFENPENRPVFRHYIKVRKMKKHMRPWRKAYKKDLGNLLRQIERRALEVNRPWPKSIIEQMRTVS
ncbi:MAG TPA: hypothetical protein EYO73_04085 [Sulfurimonas sp.]|nr:hypothetical protein [Sulfurimonas sp.]